ncbi:hypothetical protein [Polaromonas aquatica]|uniref:hypothetical protein n=1 Tax=Polaromonas aquatica TaxID=332657 RepID=UPI003D65FCC1
MSANSATPFTGPHLLVPFAACSAEAWLPTMKALPAQSTRHLNQLLKGMKSVHTDTADAHTLSTPHERALALALGLATADTPDGLIPWAAQDAAQHLQGESGKAWAWVTPCHWAMGREHATLTDPAALGLDDAESRALLAAMQPYFDSDGITLRYVPALGAGQWLAEGELFRALPTASLDRVMGRNVDPWLPGGKTEAKDSTARKIKLLQNEMQMLLYTHALNDERAERRQLPVNSFWLSGTGALPAGYAPGGQRPTVPRSLAQAVFADDWEAYAQAWAALDAGDIAQLLARQRAGEAVRLTLCGERGWQTFETHPADLMARISSLLMPQPLWYERNQL